MLTTEQYKNVNTDSLNVKAIYFIGIGGIGMSALARYFHAKGSRVNGYDKTASPLTRALEAEGIPIHYEDNIDLSPKDAELVVYTPAIPADHSELNYFRSQGYKTVKRSDVLQMISENTFNICVAGTHGKTTITTMVAHLLRDTGFGCNAFLGGISSNYNTNFWANENNVCVIEADEYDRSFLKLSPDIAVISAMDADHLDIYGTAEEVDKAFIGFSDKIKPGGLLVKHFGLKRGEELVAENQLSYSLQNESADVYGVNIRMKNGAYMFDVAMKTTMLEDVELNMGGMHNVENMIAAITVADYLGIEREKIKRAVADFKGVKRRFEYIVSPTQAGQSRPVYIDDYAHHPDELTPLINSVKTLFAGRKCTIIFQPHLYSRTRDFADEFAKALDLADEVILLPLYPARELPIEGVSSEMILEKMNNPSKKIMPKEEVTAWIKNELLTTGGEEKVLVTAGAGDIDRLVPQIKNILEID